MKLSKLVLSVTPLVMVLQITNAYTITVINNSLTDNIHFHATAKQGSITSPQGLDGIIPPLHSSIKFTVKENKKYTAKGTINVYNASLIDPPPCPIAYSSYPYYAQSVWLLCGGFKGPNPSSSINTDHPTFYFEGSPTGFAVK